jgi:hypothetical protein
LKDSGRLATIVGSEEGAAIDDATVVTVHGASEAELEELAELLRGTGAEMGPTMREPAGGDLSFDPGLVVDVGFKVLGVVGPLGAKALVDWVVARLEARRKQGEEPEEADFVVEVRGEHVAISGTASPEAIRLALEAALAARQ